MESLDRIALINKEIEMYLNNKETNVELMDGINTAVPTPTGAEIVSEDELDEITIVMPFTMMVGLLSECISDD